MNSEYEIMAPVGSRESLVAAIQAGADSIYFGIGKLNMRAHSASTFTIDDLKEIAQTCREYGIKSYLTVNTIIYGEDIPLMHEIIDAAKTAELDRKVLDEYYVGSEIVTEERFFYDIISCHVGRRSFVTNSFAKDMSAPSIMKCTGHSSYKTMQPYIDSEASSQTREMQKWNTNPCKQKIINYLNGANDEDLQRLLDFINKKDII